MQGFTDFERAGDVIFQRKSASHGREARDGTELRRRESDQTDGNFTHLAPRWALFTTVSMNAMPSTPSSIVGKS